MLAITHRHLEMLILTYRERMDISSLCPDVLVNRDGTLMGTEKISMPRIEKKLSGSG